jgi:Flp pilus assembly pilin Flp
MLLRWSAALWRDEDGQDLVEYALLMAFVALAAVSLLQHVSSNISSLWNTLSSSLSDAITSLG